MNYLNVTYYRDLLLSSSLTFYCCDININNNLWGPAIFTVNYWSWVTDISKKNCYEKNPEKTNQPILRKTLN